MNDSPYTSSPATAGYDEERPRMAFFTDTTVCIGCKACEVACKEWNDVPSTPLELTGFSYDNTGGLGSESWRAVKFVEQRLPEIRQQGADGAFVAAGQQGPDLRMVGTDGFAGTPDELDLTRADVDGRALAVDAAAGAGDFRWLMASDVCKHCTTAACLDVCPTGALFKTEFATVVLQDDICNGCGYCVPACPYGVVDRRPDDGRAFKCTMCYDRMKGDMTPACAQSCPTDSIMFGTWEDMRAAAGERLEEVVAAGLPGAQLYGEDTENGVDGCGAFFLLLDDPEVYGLPPDPIATTKDLPGMWRAAARAAAAMVVGIAGVVLVAGGRDRR